MTDEMRLREVLEDSNPFYILFKIFVMLVGGICLNWIDIFPVDWLMPLLCVGIYFTKISAVFMQSSAEGKRYHVENANAYAEQKHFEAKQAEAKAGELQTLLKQANEKANQTTALANEVQALRQQLSNAQAKIANDAKALDQAKQMLKDFEQSFEQASANVEKRIADAKANAVKEVQTQLKALSPYRKYFELEQQRSACRSVINNKLSTQEEKEKARGDMEAVKEQLKEIETQLS